MTRFKRIKNYKETFIKSFKKEPLFYTLFFLIIIIGVFFRVYKWEDRIYTHSDNSLYAQIAKYSNDTLNIPQIGVFPQAQFFTGPEWLWFLQIFYLLPFGIISPWVAMSFFSILSIFLVYYLGREIGNKWVGTVAAFFAAISPAAIDNSFSVWNTSADPFLHILALIFLVRFYKFKKSRDIFLTALLVGIAVTVRFQLLITIPIIAVALFSTRPKLKYFLAAVIGFIIPLLPFLIFDLRFHWFEFKRVYDYVTIAQYRIYVPNRWLTYAGVWWPSVWGSVIGSSSLVGGFLIFLVTLATILNLKRFKKNILYFLVAFSFIGEVFLFRYFRGERFVYYGLFAQGPIFTLTAWALWKVFRIQKFVGIALVAVLAVLTLPASFGNFAKRDIPLDRVQLLKQEIYSNFAPDTKFDIYGCSSVGALMGRPLALLMYGEGRNSNKGTKIGVCWDINRKYIWVPLVDGSEKNENSWFAATTSTTHDSAIEWWKKNPPK